MHMVDTEPFSDTFGPKAQRKRPKLKVSTLEDLAASTNELLENYDEKSDPSLLSNNINDWIDEARDSVFSKGQSKRIWNELYKVSVYFVLVNFSRPLILHVAGNCF
jgi:nuclear GTP-binding protein